jgi:hypothetical protein
MTNDSTLTAKKAVAVIADFIGALPPKLTPEQCIEAVENFCRDVTQDRVSCHFALHLDLNPHAHIRFRDRDIETNRPGAKERAQLPVTGAQFQDTAAFRQKWNAEMNLALERAGHAVKKGHQYACLLSRDPLP